MGALEDPDADEPEQPDHQDQQRDGGDDIGHIDAAARDDDFLVAVDFRHVHSSTIVLSVGGTRHQPARSDGALPLLSEGPMRLTFGSDWRVEGAPAGASRAESSARKNALVECGSDQTESSQFNDIIFKVIFPGARDRSIAP
jgi:hypothetical protein